MEDLISSVQNLYKLVECFNSSISNLQKLAGNENVFRYVSGMLIMRV